MLIQSAKCIDEKALTYQVDAPNGISHVFESCIQGLNEAMWESNGGGTFTLKARPHGEIFALAA